jgi:replicative DNA helicase
MTNKASKDKVITGKRHEIIGIRASNTGAESSGGLQHGVYARSMPESLAAEAAVLGSMMVDPECISEVVEQLKMDAFYRIEHQMIFDAMVTLYEKNKGGSLDAVLLRDELEKRGQLEEVGGVEYLAKIMESVPSSANVMYYAGIIKDKQLLRELVSIASEILEDAYRGDGEPGEKLDEAEHKIFAITDKKVRGSATKLKDLVVHAYELIEKRKEGLVTGLATGFHELDDCMCGLQNGEMIILAGRPSMGKTSLALNIAEYIGLIGETPIAIFSLEMGRQQLAERFLCSKSAIDAQKVRKGLLDTEHYEALVKACGEFSEAPIYIDDTSLLTPLELRAKARRLKSQRGIRCIMVDYLQLMYLGTGRVESRQQEVTIISRYLKALAGELNIPIVVLSQLNRAPEGREDHKPRMSDLRESGSIEQDADVVLLLHREDYYRRSERQELSEKESGTIRSSEDGRYEENTAEIIIAKQRNGPTGSVKLTFRKQIMRFENFSYASAEGEREGVAPF